jgi:hypothetical protein
MDRIGIFVITASAALLGALAAGALLPGRADAGAPAPAARTSRWECTRFRVPESSNPSLRGPDGVLASPPADLGPAFRPLVMTVVLPEGFQPFGGGDGSVIACKLGTS